MRSSSLWLDIVKGLEECLPPIPVHCSGEVPEFLRRPALQFEVMVRAPAPPCPDGYEDRREFYVLFGALVPAVGLEGEGSVGGFHLVIRPEFQ